MILQSMAVRCMWNGVRKRGHLILRAERYVIELGEEAILAQTLYLYISRVWGTQLKLWIVLGS
jgi:hypothetical protein